MPSLQDFKSSFTTDLARPNRFDVVIPVPYYMLTQFNNAKQLSMRCESAELPGRAFDTTNRVIGSLPVQKFPIKTIYNDVTMTFIVSGDMQEKVFFDTWQELVNPAMNYNFKYKNDYAVDIVINQYDLQNQLSYSCTLIDAYPIAINQLNVDWTSVDSVHKLSVVFAYTSWFNNSVQDALNVIETNVLSGIADDVNKALY